LIVSIIPARGGSKGIPRKNIKDFCGLPLITHTIRDAQACSQIARVYVSTDDAEIAGISVAAGAHVIDRPDFLAAEFSQSEDVLLHALEEIGETVEGVVFLQCTSPLRLKGDITKAVMLFRNKMCDSVFSATALHQYLRFDGYKNWFPDIYPRKMRSAKNPAIIENGSIYIFKPEIFKEQKVRLCGIGRYFIQPWYCGLELDNLEDWEICEQIWEIKRDELA